MALLDAALADGLPADRLLVITGSPALPDSVESTRHALANGIHRVLLLPPYYFKGSSDEALKSMHKRGFNLQLAPHPATDKQVPNQARHRPLFCQLPH